MNISSIIVKTKPEYLVQVINDLKSSKICDIHLNDDLGRIIVTIEAPSIDKEINILKTIQTIPHVLSADMQMSYSENELEKNMSVLENADLVPHILNDENIEVENIIYKGDLKKKDLENFSKEFNS